MPRLSLQDLARVRAFCEHVASYDADGSPILDQVMEPMRELLGTEKAVAYVLGQRGESGFRVERLRHAGAVNPKTSAILDAWLADKTVGWTGFNPGRPEPAQRNVALTLAEVDRLSGLRSEESPMLREVYPAAGIDQRDQLRILLCDGPSLLAWVAAFQPTPFDARQKALLKRVAPALRRRLLLESKLASAGTIHAALGVAMEALGAAAFLMSDAGHPLEANTAGKAALRHDEATTRGALQDAVRDGKSAGFSVTRVKSRGSQDAFLLVKLAAGGPLEARAAQAEARWGLTRRQAQILGLVVEGRSNRAIAAVLEVGERTIEAHLTTIYERAQVEGRSELVARLWGL